MAEQVLMEPSCRKLLEGEHWSVVEWMVDSHGDRILQIVVPLPYSLRWVNAYMLQDGADWTIIDPGLNTDVARQVWHDVLAGLHLSYRDMKRIILTHYHPDHLGLAGWMQEQSGAVVYLSEVGKQHMEMLWGKEQQMTAAMASWFRKQGVPAPYTEQLKEHMDSFMPLVHPLPKITLLHRSAVVRMGNRSWAVLETAGHAPGHMSFYCEADQLLMAGDHVLPQITPNVSLMPNSDPEPLLHYMEGLDALAQLDVRMAFPGHRHPFRHVASRVEMIKQHHEARLAEWQQWLEEEPATAYTVCSRAFGTVGKLTVHQFRFAMGETLAHLRELERRGMAASREEQGVMIWCTA